VNMSSLSKKMYHNSCDFIKAPMILGTVLVIDLFFVQSLTLSIVGTSEMLMSSDSAQFVCKISGETCSSLSPQVCLGLLICILFYRAGKWPLLMKWALPT
jgi:hypothetical protein